MKDIVNIYGEFFLEVIVIGLLSLHIFAGMRDNNGNLGVFHIIGKKLVVENVNHEEYLDFKEGYIKESNRSMPQIYFLNSHMDIGVYKVSDMFVAYDCVGRSLPVSVKSIRDVNGKELVHAYNAISNEIYFSLDGIYTVELETMDTDYRIYECKIRIPVCESK